MGAHSTHPMTIMKQYPARLTAIALAALCALTTHAAELESTTPVPAKTNSEAWWNSNCKRIDDDIQKMEGEIDVAFVGDSITARWRGSESWEKHWGSYRAVNMGIGGDQTQHVLWRLENGQLDGYTAKLFVVMIGTNNLWARDADPAHAAAGVKAVLELIQAKHPDSRILLMSLLPTGKEPNPGRDKRAAVNEIISKFAGGQVEYVDVWDKYLEPDGTISKEVMHDFLHLAPKGYDIWAEAIGERVKQIVEGGKTGLPLTRTLTDSQGRSIEATIVTIEGEAVSFTRDGEQHVFTIPIATLSEEDQAFLRKIVERTNHK